MPCDFSAGNVKELDLSIYKKEAGLKEATAIDAFTVSSIINLVSQKTKVDELHCSC